MDLALGSSATVGFKEAHCHSMSATVTVTDNVGRIEKGDSVIEVPLQLLLTL